MSTITALDLPVDLMPEEACFDRGCGGVLQHDQPVGFGHRDAAKPGISRAGAMMLRQAALFLCLAAPAMGQGLLQFPTEARQTVTDSQLSGRYLVPTGPWDAGGIPAFEALGLLRRDVWQIADFTAGTGVLLAVLTGQLEDAGFDPIFSCTDRVCGGFDFRFALDITAEPDMHVNLADYAFYAARRDTPEGPEYAALIVSQGGGTGFVETVHVSPQGTELAGVTLSSRGPDVQQSSTSQGGGDLATALSTIGRAPLPGVNFAYGSTELADPSVPILQELAAFLLDNPEIQLTLVGHTDAEGGLQSNISVSRARATTVRRILIDEYGIAANRLLADGVGFLMPLALNTTQEGRDINRRVEAVVINTQ